MSDNDACYWQTQRLFTANCLSHEMLLFACYLDRVRLFVSMRINPCLIESPLPGPLPGGTPAGMVTPGFLPSRDTCTSLYIVGEGREQEQLPRGSKS